MRYRFIILTIICTNLLSTYVISQTDTSQLRGIVSEECFGITKYDDEYIIRLNGVDYSDKEKAYICENDLPMNVEILYKDNEQPVNGAEWDWSDCECNPADPVGHTASISISPIDNFQGGEKLKIKVQFDDLEDQATVDIQLVVEVRLFYPVEPFEKFRLLDHEETQEISLRAYDENRFLPYPGSDKDVRYKFLLESEADGIAFLQNKTVPRSLNPTSVQEGLTYSILDKKLYTEYDSELSGPEPLILETHVCNLPIIENNVYKEILEADIYVWKVRESDDDILMYDILNPSLTKDGNLITDVNFRCIDPGPDGTLDLYRYMQDGQLQDQDWLDFDNDNIVNRYTSQMEVLAGPDLECQSESYLYHTTNSESPRVSSDFDVDISLIQERINMVYEQVGIKFNVIDKGDLLANFDILYEDEELSEFESNYASTALENDDESTRAGYKIFLHKRINDPPAQPGTSGSVLRGFANTALQASFIDYTRKYSNTISHEIGHAVFELSHCDETPNTEGILTPVFTDKNNLMISGEKNSGDVNLTIIRKYLWKIIRNGL